MDSLHDHDNGDAFEAAVGDILYGFSAFVVGLFHRDGVREGFSLLRDRLGCMFETVPMRLDGSTVIPQVLRIESHQSIMCITLDMP